MKSAVYCLQVKSCWTTHSSCLTTFSTCQEVCGYPDNQPRHLEVMLEDCWCWNRTKLKLLFQKLPSFTLLRIGKKDKGLLIFSYRLARRRVGIGKRIRGPHFSRENPHLNPISHFSGPNSIFWSQNVMWEVGNGMWAFKILISSFWLLFFFIS